MFAFFMGSFRVLFLAGATGLACQLPAAVIQEGWETISTPGTTFSICLDRVRIEKVGEACGGSGWAVYLGDPLTEEEVRSYGRDGAEIYGIAPGSRRIERCHDIGCFYLVEKGNGLIEIGTPVRISDEQLTAISVLLKGLARSCTEVRSAR